MYKMLASQSEKNKSSHPDWRVAFCGGPMGQIEETQAETNEYLRIPYPLSAGDTVDGAAGDALTAASATGALLACALPR